MELENMRLKAQEEVQSRDLEIAQLKALLSRVLKERDEAQMACQKACLQIALLHKQLQDTKRRRLPAPHSGVSGVEDLEPSGKIDRSLTNALSSSDCDDSIGSSPPRRPASEADLPVVPAKALPEKGRLLQAVMRAGPLLQTLLIAGGPLPEWRHPPPPMDSHQIPPPPLLVPPPADGGRISRKRAHH
ncbi:hypothetical protein STAS_16326 [Striga asiatica]|uniref:Uncharacterized protein n=1 Tax=Striga asiatica TaxID=4170 RepID=A0A5A7Q462_STRAF|nr:hypothetical protein STAS_16326 [Striga asiatica]